MGSFREPNFGVMLRARRLCYCWVASRGFYMRTRDIDGGFLVELAPPVSAQLKDDSGKGRNRGQRFRVFDNDAQADQAIQLSPYLSSIKSVKRYFQVKLGEDGMPL